MAKKKKNKKTAKKVINKKKRDTIHLLTEDDHEALRKARDLMRKRKDVEKIKINSFTRAKNMSYHRDIRHLTHLEDAQAFVRSAALEHFSRKTKHRVRTLIEIMKEVFSLEKE